MEIPHPESDQLILDGARRLTGPSLVWSETGAILDVLVDGIDLERVLECWNSQIDDLLSAVAWEQPKLAHRRFENGFNLLLAAPIDQLYSALQVLETAWYFCCCELLDIEVESRDQLLEDIRSEMQNEKNSALLEIQAAAASHGVDILVDDDEVSIGHGVGSISYPIDQIPAPKDVDWAGVHDIPVALITGTNGKSTSVRLLDGIARAAGQISGVTSTDFVRVGEDVLDHGDYSGPGGARLLLRDQRLEIAFLEVARGGILRRGLPLRHARAALVTNVASDHLGQYGVNTLAALTETKFAVQKALTEDAVLVVNADDEGIVRYLEKHAGPRLSWFSLERSNSVIEQQIGNRQSCCFVEDGNIISYDGDTFTSICGVADIPMTLGGAALHNVRNALGAVAVAAAMGFTSPQISAGLQHFNSDESDNPGRLNSFQLHSAGQVFVDFAHNAHSVAAVTDTVARLPARHKWALCSSAGDRSDEDIAAIARGVCAISPDHVIIAEVEPYLRGRALGEVGEIMQQACLQNGLSKAQIHFAQSPLAGVRFALENMQSEDLGLFLVLSERDEVIAYLHTQ